jgi:hypothetical protein
MLRLLTIALLFLVPFLILPFGESHFESPKVVIAEILMLSVFLLSFWKNPLIYASKKYLPFYALGILSLFHLLFLSGPTTFFGNVFRGQGVLLLWALLLFSISISMTKVKMLPRFGIYLLLVLQLVAAVFIEGKDARAIGTIGEPNALAAFAIFFWPFLFLNTDKKTTLKNKKVEWCILFGSSSCIFTYRFFRLTLRIYRSFSTAELFPSNKISPIWKVSHHQLTPPYSEFYRSAS